MRRRAFLPHLALPAAFAQSTQPPLPLIFDTDIGTDVDDAFALAVILNSPELRLAGVTTVHGNALRRAQYASLLIDAMGLADIPCCAGCPVPLSPSPSGIAFRGHAARLRGIPISAYRDDGDLGATVTPAISARHAVDFLIEATRPPSGPRHLLVVGPQTNLALGLLRDPTLADRLDAVTLMGFDFQKGVDRYNVGWDLDAARHVLASGIPINVLPVEIGVACQMNAAEYERCLASSSPHMRFLAPHMKRWVQFVRTRPAAPLPDYLPRPYDSLAALTITHPALFEWKRGTISLERGDDPSRVRAAFRESAGGIHRVVAAVDRQKAMALHMERLLKCSCEL